MEASEDATIHHVENVDLAGTYFSETSRFSEIPRMRRALSSSAATWGLGQKKDAPGSGGMALLELPGSEIDPSQKIKPHLTRRILVPCPVHVLLRVASASPPDEVHGGNLKAVWIVQRVHRWHTFISQKVFTKSFRKSQFPHESVNLFFISAIIKDKSMDLQAD